MMKQKKTLFFILVSILSIIFLYWLFSVVIIDAKENNKIKKSMIDAENNYKRLSNERKNYTEIKDNWEKQSQFFDSLKVHMPLRKNSKGPSSYIGTLDIIFKIAEDNNISIDKINPILINNFPEIVVAKRKLDQNIIRYIVEIECNGDFFSIGRFFEELQNHRRMINLLKFNIETEYRSTGGLFCEVILNTYIIVEDN
ncbi:hypothetical protein ACFLZA_01550 [Candidatus Neomarinimicrobiota bacterium]